MCSQETLLDKAYSLGQPYYHSYPFDFYSFQFHINMIRFFQFVIEIGSIFASTTCDG